MKKIFLFVAALTLSLTSCSSDDNSGGNGGGGNSELKVTIDGAQKTFNTIVVNENIETYDGETWTELIVTATINNNPSEVFIFNLDLGDVGADAIWYFTYKKDGEEYISWNQWANISSVVQTNNNKKIKGTFTGKLAYNYWDDNSQQEVVKEVNLTNGSFDISY
jgi:hypothetical protein